MRDVSEIKRDYYATLKNDSIVEFPNGSYGYVNSEKRKELRKEYIGTLPANKNLAIFLHDKLCKCNHTDECSWVNEIIGMEDDWCGRVHSIYLKKADAALREENSADTIKKIIEAVTENY